MQQLKGWLGEFESFILELQFFESISLGRPEENCRVHCIDLYDEVFLTVLLFHLQALKIYKEYVDENELNTSIDIAEIHYYLGAARNRAYCTLLLPTLKAKLNEE